MNDCGRVMISFYPNRTIMQHWNIMTDWESLEHTDGYWVGKRSRLFHSAGVNHEMLPTEKHNNTPIVEWELRESNLT